MKNLSPAIAAHIQTMGTEPLNILEVQWVTDGPYLKYGDKEVTDIAGTILQLSNLESVIKLDSQGQSQSISVTLEDTSNEIKDIINTTDIHGKTVRLLQWFDGLPLSEAFELYEGEISSPIVWSEGDRTISFSVITKLADKEVGFSPEEAYYPLLDSRLVGKAWPMAFGIVQNVPAIRLQDLPATQSAQDLGVVDPSIDSRSNEVRKQINELDEARPFLIAAALSAAINRFNACFPDDTGPDCDSAQSALDSAEDALNQNAAAKGQAIQELASITSQKSDQEEQANTTLELIDGTGFTDGPITVEIGGVELSGTISGKVITIGANVIEDFDYTDKYDSIDGDNNVPFGFTFIEAGTTVTIKTDAEVTYVANILDSEVKSVQAFKQVENGQVLVTIAASLYTVTKVTSGPYTFTLIKFARPLSSLDTTIGNDIFVTLESPVGPNTVDIMLWLIDTYTDLTYDANSFNAVSLKLENYPSHFALLQRKDILTMLEEMAFQARCAIWISNGVFFIKYLSEEVSSIATITETDIDAGSLVMEATQTEEVVTNLVATWTDDYAEAEKNKIVLRHNVKKYGSREREVDFYIYNIPELVVKSATFWLMRLANVWKTVTFNTYVHNLALESFDTIKLSFAQNFISTLDTKGLITDVTFNTSEHLLTVSAWVPIRFGEMEKYDFSWPSQILTHIQFPTNTDILEQFAGGAGPGVEVEGDDVIKITGVTPKFQLQENGERDQREDYGQEFPSDLNDTKPEPAFAGVSYTKGEKPAFDYNYGGSYIITTDQSEFKNVPGTFPGKVLGVASISDTTTLAISVYTSVLSSSPIEKLVTLLGEPRDIVADTWVTVMKNLQPVDDEGNRISGLNDDGFEWSTAVTEGGNNSFPSVIKEHINLISQPQQYGVDVYETGLEGLPTRKIVLQLQGSVGEAIPLDSWVMTVKSKLPTENVSLNDDGFEWTMQVPVWL